jgi:hypothetical protein
MATGPCQAGSAGTHYYIYLGGGESQKTNIPQLVTHEVYVITLYAYAYADESP